MNVDSFPYVWSWRERLGMPCLAGRFGQRCRVVVRGPMNSAWIEFDDGFAAMVSRNGLRRARPQPIGLSSMESRPYPALAELVEAIIREHHESEVVKAGAISVSEAPCE